VRMRGDPHPGLNQDSVVDCVYCRWGPYGQTRDMLFRFSVIPSWLSSK